MPNNLTDTARRAYQRRRVYIPAWMQLAQWVAVAVIPVVLVISYVIDREKPLPEYTPVPTEITAPVVGDERPSNVASGETTRVTKASGGFAVVPTEALDAARKAGLALWTGDWAGVPVSGNAPTTGAIFPDAALGDPSVYSRTDNVVVFVFPLDTDADGSDDQTFQISVVSEGGDWVFPSAAG